MSDIPFEPDDDQLGVRERKKAHTRRALHVAALDLVSEHGVAQVSTEQIAAAAGVSSRTFFNYFATKEAALTGTSELLVDKVVEFVASRPGEESSYQIARAIAERMVELGTRDEKAWRTRRTLLQQHPELAHLAVGSQREAALAMVVALRDRPTPGPAWLPGMLGLVSFDAARVALQLGTSHDHAMAMVGQIMDALRPGLEPDQPRSSSRATCSPERTAPSR